MLEQAALARASRETADVFLWAAHRSLEAMLRALLTAYPPRRFSELTVKELLDDAASRTLIPHDWVPEFQRLWRLSRVAVRVRDHQVPDYVAAVVECAQALAATAEWLYERSEVKRPIPADVAEAIETLRSGKVVVSRELAARRRQQSLEQALDAAIAERRRFIDALAGLAAGVTTELERERESVDEAAVKLESLKQASEQQGEGFPSFSVQSPGAPPSAEGLFQRWQWVLGIAGGVVLGVIVVMAVIGQGGPSAAGSGGGPLASEADSGEAVVEGADVGVDGAVDADVEEAEVVEAEAEPEASCPDGMVEFEAAQVRVLQPFPRRSWPSGPKQLPPVEVERFCLDRDPVLVSEYEACVRAGECPRRRDCLDHPRNFPVNCITWEDADAYCRWRGGRLPSVVQWERTLLSGGNARAEPIRGTWEWTTDPFPAPVLQRGPVKTLPDGSIWGYMALQKQFVPANGGRRMCSWHKVPADASRGNLSFRCAIEVE